MHLLLHLFEACILQPLLQVPPGTRLSPSFPRRLEKRLISLVQRSASVGVVRRAPLQIKVHELDVAARPRVREAAPDKRRPVLEGRVQRAAVDEVERLRVRPVSLDVVDLEAHVGRDPARLNRAEVVAEHLALRELVAELHGPDARAGAEVEGPRGLELGEGCGVKLAVHGDLDHLVRDVEPVLLLVVVGEHVLAVAVRVVPPAVFMLVIGDATGERGSVARTDDVARVSNGINNSQEDEKANISDS